MKKLSIWIMIILSVIAILLIAFVNILQNENTQALIPTSDSSGLGPRHWMTIPYLPLGSWATWTEHEIVFQQAHVQWNDPNVIEWLSNSYIDKIGDIEEYRIAGSSAGVPSGWSVRVWVQTNQKSLQGKFPIVKDNWEGTIKIKSFHPDMIVIMELLNTKDEIDLVRQISFVSYIPQ